MIEKIDKLKRSVDATLGMISVPDNASVFGEGLEAVYSSVKKIAWRTSKLDQSQNRNAAVSVYGPSQVGKSYLASVLVRPDDGYLKINFPGEVGSLNYISDMNPGGDKECTGLVTRFTVNSGHSNEKFPVYLRLLTEIDVICILVNSYFSEGDQRYEEHRTAADIDDHIRKIGTDKPGNCLKEEDFWELEEYITEQFSGFDYARTMLPFLDIIGKKAINCSITQRASLYAPLWGFHDHFTNLFEKMLTALADLNYSNEIFANISALIPKTSSIIDVSALSKIYSNQDDKVAVCGSSGKETEISRGLLSAITAELVLDINSLSHKFFDHTDILDFPGTRPRQMLNLDEVFSGFSEEENNVHQFLLRGKVAYLFDKYVNSQDINSMLLCVKHSNMNAVGLPAMVEKWVNNSIGNTPQIRRGKDNNLFFIMTYFDEHLKDGASNIKETDRFSRRLYSSLLERFGNHKNTWVINWDGSETKTKAFNNCYFLRNPGVSQKFFNFDSKTGIENFAASADEKKRIAEIKNIFMDTPEIKTHFNNPKLAWDAVMLENDGGASYILKNLEKVCRPETKTDQLNSLAVTLSNELSAQLSEYYVHTNIAERERASMDKFDALKKQLQNESNILKDNQFAQFLMDIGLTDEIFIARLSDVQNFSDLVSNACTIWSNSASAACNKLAKKFNIEKSSLEFLVHELSDSMKLRHLNNKIKNSIKFLTFQGLTKNTKSRAIEIACFTINEFIYEKEMSPRSTNDFLQLSIDHPDLQKEFLDNWLITLKTKIQENSKAENGHEFNQEANTLIGSILSDLENP